VPNDFAPAVRLKKLEAIAKSVPLADDRINRHRSQRKRKVQLHDLTHRNFNSEHGCKSGFANVHGIALQHAARPGMDTDSNREFEPRVATSVTPATKGDGYGLFLNFQFDPLRLRPACKSITKSIPSKLWLTATFFSCGYG